MSQTPEDKQQLMQSILEQVRHLKAENERLSNQPPPLTDEMEAFIVANGKLMEEVQRLRKENERLLEEGQDSDELETQLEALQQELLEERSAAEDRAKNLEQQIEQIRYQKSDLEHQLEQARNDAEQQRLEQRKQLEQARQEAEQQRLEQKKQSIASKSFQKRFWVAAILVVVSVVVWQVDSSAKRDTITSLRSQLERQSTSPNAVPSVASKDYSTPEGFVLIPGGSFKMGSPEGEGYGDEHPQHGVEISSFYLMEHEVTVAEYRGCVEAGQCKKPRTGGSCNWGTSGRENHPINCVSWEDAHDYIDWKNDQLGLNCDDPRQTSGCFRLPSEAEWEYAAKQSNPGKYGWGNKETDACRYGNVADQTAKRKNTDWMIINCEDGYVGTSPVKSFASLSNLYDMHGNVWEWVEDVYKSDIYKGRDGAKDPIYTGGGDGRVIRGGSWLRNASGLRSAYRSLDRPVVRFDVVGFRLARTR